ncbi:phosphate acetyltransferase [Buchnera aphidicola (Pterocomma populeum)]
MSHIIMLVPINNNVGSTAISLSLLDFLNKNKHKKESNKSILYISCQNNILNNTAIIINKYFSYFIDILQEINFSNVTLGSSIYFSLLDHLIEKCFENKYLYEFILIEGLNKEKNIYSDQINYDIAQNLNAEVILLSNIIECTIKYYNMKENEIKLFLKKYEYKKFLGVIFNEINSIFLGKKNGFIDKLKFLKNNIIENKKNIILEQLINNTVFPIIAFIPWNKDLMEIFSIDIYRFLNAMPIHISNMYMQNIEKIIIFNRHEKNILHKNNSCILIIVPINEVSNFIQYFIEYYNHKSITVLLSGKLTSIQYLQELCKTLINMNISIFFINKNIIDIICILQNFHFNLNIREKDRINQLQKYISSFFNINKICLFKEKKYTSIIFSPREFCHHLKVLSRRSKKRIILPESYEIRILHAVSICDNLNIAKCVLLGDPQKIYNIAKEKGIYLSKRIEIINPDLVREKYFSQFMRLRKHKGIDEYYAKKQLQDNIILATLMVESDEVDGMVSGSINTTASTIRPALQLIKTNISSSLISSIFFMLLPKKVLIYGDCAININPTAEELAEIAIQSSHSAEIFGIEPRIAMLSYSTGSSGTGQQVEKVKKATSIVKLKRPDLIIDGPIQYDAAVSKKISQLKMPFSSLLGSASIFIFPDLNSGNITYKAVQRSAQLVSIGPMLQGLRKPVNDLSRGSSIEDIIYTIALTAIQSK